MARAAQALFVRQDAAAEAVHAFERHAAAAHDAGQRLLGDQHRQAGLLGQQAIEVAQQRAAAGQHHAALGDVGAELGRGLLERDLDRRDDLVERIGQRLEHLVAADREAARHALGQVAALDFHFLDLGAGEGRADLLLDSLCGLLADQHAVVAADVVDDGIVELVAADAHAALVDHAAQADDADLGGAAADVDHHRARRLRHRQAGADRGGHGFLDQVDRAGAGGLGRVLDRAPLDLGRAAGHADDDARARRQQAARVHHLDELLDHLLGDDEVGDHAVLHRADRLDVAGHLAQHGLGFLADGLDGLLAARAAFVADRDHRGLVEHDALVAHVDQGVGGAEVDRQVGGEMPTENFEHVRVSCAACLRSGTGSAGYGGG